MHLYRLVLSVVNNKIKYEAISMYLEFKNQKEFLYTFTNMTK